MIRTFEIDSPWTLHSRCDFCRAWQACSAPLLIALAVLVICDMVIERYILEPHHDLADRRRDLLHRRRDLHRQPLRADDARPRQRRHPAAASRAARAVLACAVHEPAGAGVLRRDVHSLHRVLVRGLYASGGSPIRCGGRGCGFPSFDAGRARACWCCNMSPTLLCLVTGRASPFGIRTSRMPKRSRAPRPSKRWEARHEPDHARRFVLVVTLLMLLSGIPVAFGLGAIAIAFLAIFQGFDACTSSPRPSGPGSTNSRSSRSRCS